MSNPRIMVTLTAPLVDFLDHVKHETGQGYAVTLRNLAIFSREFAEFRKDQARQAAEAAKASTKTTVVVEARPTREQMLAEEQERRRRIREQEAHPPWPTLSGGPCGECDFSFTCWKNEKPCIREVNGTPEQENKEAFCHHGNQVRDSAGYQVFCFECSMEAGHEICHEHREAKPCPYCSMDEIGEAAP